MTTEVRTRAVLAFTVLAAALPVAAAGGTSAISIVSTTKGYLGSDKTQVATAHNGTTLVTYDARGVNKLVIAIGTEASFNGKSIDVTGLTFNGTGFTQIVQERTLFGDGGTAEIWYLDNPYQGTGTFSVSTVSGGGGANGGVVAIIGLAGTAYGAAGIGDSDAANYSVAPITSSITTTADDSLVIAMVENSGTPNSAGTPSVNSPLTLIANGSWGNQWGGVAAGYQFVSNSGTTVTPTFTTNNGGTYAIHTVAAEFIPGVPHNLTLRVDPVTGDTKILGDATRTFSINYYQITSAGNSLDAAHWSSLADQDFEGGGSPNGTGNGWEEAGGAGSHALAEAFLLGNSAIGASASISLGKGYNVGVGAEDLVFTYRTDAGKITDGLVEYVTSALPGDANLDGVVDAADYIVLKKNFGTASGARYRNGDFDGDRDADWDDLQILTGNFGAGGLADGIAPEPASLGLLAIGAMAVIRRRRGHDGFTWGETHGES